MSYNRHDGVSDRVHSGRRSRSPDTGHHRPHRTRSRSPKARPASLPFSAEQLSKRDLEGYRALFALYLDIQKQKDVEELSHHELRGRWKSFVGKWNRGDLAEGWYDPLTKHKADSSVRAPQSPQTEVGHNRNSRGIEEIHVNAPETRSDDSGDEYGPGLPSAFASGGRFGPAVPRLDDLQQRNELAREDDESRREGVRHERKEERRLQKERLEEVAPRAEPGSRERQLEKKREKAAVNRSFRDAKSPEVQEVGEGELLGDDGVEGYKARVKAASHKQSERELRKEEILRARAAEREEKMAVHRAKESKTMDMLQALAKQRFG